MSLGWFGSVRSKIALGYVPGDSPCLLVLALVSRS